MKSTEAQLRARKKYYEKHKDYYLEKSKENQKKNRAERTLYKKKCEEIREYVINELLDGDLEWHKNHYGCISGSDLPNYCILKIIEILDK